MFQRRWQPLPVQSESMGNAENPWAMKIEFTEGVRRPKDHIQAAKLSSKVGIQIRDKMPLVTNWTQYKKR
jgi:hypothetical protein